MTDNDKVVAKWDAMRQMAYDISSALYDGGWRVEDREALIAEHDLSEEEANIICERLKMYEEEEES